MVIANFVEDEPPTTYTLTTIVNPTGSGSVTGGGTYDPDVTATVLATAATDWHFTGWSVDLTGDTNPEDILMDGNKMVIANFELIPEITYDLTMKVSPTGSGTTTPTIGTHSGYAAGRSVSISAIAASGYEFVDWTGDVADPNSATTTVTMDADKTVTANFEEDEPPVLSITVTKTADPQTYSLLGDVITYTIVVKNTGNVTLTNIEVTDPKADITSGSQIASLDPGATATVMASHIIDARDMLVGSFTNTATATTDEGATASANETVTNSLLLLLVTLTMQVNPSIGGTTIPEVGPHTYLSGTVVDISAIAEPGYEFVDWTGNVADPNSATTTVTMDADKTVTANFESAIAIDGLHANLGSGDGTDVWDLHVWASINNTSGQVFPGKMKIKSYQEGTTITKYYPATGYAAISITPGKNRYPSGNDYWLMVSVATGHGAQKDVKVEIWIYDTLGNQVAYASKYAN